MNRVFTFPLLCPCCVSHVPPSHAACAVSSPLVAGLGARVRLTLRFAPRGTASEGEGLGADGQERKEDTFDVFRQRMMQMYRHKRANK